MKPSRILLALALFMLLPAVVVVAEQRAIRHTAVSCFGNKADWIDIGTATLPDWGAVSRWRPDSTTPPGVTTNTLFCPVTLDVPTAPGTPINNVKIVYSTREPFPTLPGTPSTTTGDFKPTIPSCSVYLMDGTSTGTWVQQSPEGDNTGGLANNRELNIPGAVVNLGGPNPNRMLVTCQMPKTVTPLGGASVPTAMIKGYEVTYVTTAPAP
jgi:hypothetical protein